MEEPWFSRMRVEPTPSRDDLPSYESMLINIPDAPNGVAPLNLREELPVMWLTFPIADKAPSPGLALIDDALHWPSADVFNDYSRAAVLEALPFLSVLLTRGRFGSARFIKSPLAPFLYALRVRLLYGNLDRLPVGARPWLTEKIHQLVEECVARVAALVKRARATPDADSDASLESSPTCVLALGVHDTSAGLLRKHVAFALASVLLSFSELHCWPTSEAIPPALLHAYTVLSRPIFQRLFSNNQWNLAPLTVPQFIAVRPDIGGAFGKVHAVSRDAMAALTVAFRGAASIFRHDEIAGPLAIRMTLWMSRHGNPITLATLRRYCQSDPAHLELVSNAMLLADRALAMRSTRADEAHLEPTTRKSYGLYADALFTGLAPKHPISVEFALTCAPLGLPADAATPLAVPDVSLRGIAGRLCTLSTPPDLMHTESRDPDNASSLIATCGESQHIVSCTFSPADRAELLNFVHCLRFTTAAYAGYSAWCRAEHVFASTNALLVDSGAARVLMLFKVRMSSLLSMRTNDQVRFANVASLIYREIKALQQMPAGALRCELATAICETIDAAMFRRAPRTPISVCADIGKVLGFNFVDEHRNVQQIGSCELAVLHLLPVLLHTVLPRVASDAGPSPGRWLPRCLATGVSLLCRMGDDMTDTGLKLPRPIWRHVLRVFFAADRTFDSDFPMSLPAMMLGNRFAVQALAIAFITLVLSKNEVDEAVAKYGTHDHISLEKLVEQHSSIGTLDYELKQLALASSHEEPVTLREMLQLPRNSSRLLQSAYMMVYASGVRFDDATLATMAVSSGNKRSSTRSGRRGKRRADEDSMVHEVGDRLVVPDDEPPPLGVAVEGIIAGLGNPEHKERVRQAVSVTRRGKAADGGDSPEPVGMAISAHKMSMFVLTALLSAAANDRSESKYAVGAANTLIKYCASHADKIVRNDAPLVALDTALSSNDIAMLAESAVAACRHQTMGHQYRAEWFPTPGSPEDVCDSYALRSLFMLELIPLVLPRELVDITGRLGKILRQPRDMQANPAIDLTYIDTRAQAPRQSYSLYDGVHERVPTSESQRVAYSMLSARCMAQTLTTAPCGGTVPEVVPVFGNNVRLLAGERV